MSEIFQAQPEGERDDLEVSGRIKAAQVSSVGLLINNVNVHALILQLAGCGVNDADNNLADVWSVRALCAGKAAKSRDVRA